MYTKDDVAKLVSEIDERKLEPGVLLAKFAFDLGLDLYDPVSGQIMTVCRPHRRDLGEEEIMLTADQVINEVVQARRVKALADRAKGVVTPEEAKDAEKRQKSALAEKQKQQAAAERDAAKANAKV